MMLALIVSGAAVFAAIVALIFAPAIRERFRRDPSPISTVPGKKPQPAPKSASAPAGTHRAGAR